MMQYYQLDIHGKQAKRQNNMWTTKFGFFGKGFKEENLQMLNVHIY